MKAANQIHLKYVRDLTLAEAISLPEQLVKVPDNERPQPDITMPGQNTNYPTIIAKCLNNSKEHKP